MVTGLWQWQRSAGKLRESLERVGNREGAGNREGMAKPREQAQVASGFPVNLEARQPSKASSVGQRARRADAFNEATLGLESRPFDQREALRLRPWPWMRPRSTESFSRSTKRRNSVMLCNS